MVLIAVVFKLWTATTDEMFWVASWLNSIFCNIFLLCFFFFAKANNFLKNYFSQSIFLRSSSEVANFSNFEIISPNFRQRGCLLNQTFKVLPFRWIKTNLFPYAYAVSYWTVQL